MDLQKTKVQVKTPGVHGTANLKAPTYDGQTTWTMYHRQFEAAAAANGWTDQEKAAALVIALRGPALELLQTIPAAQQQEYQTLVAALDRRYGDQHRRQLYQAQIKTRLQRSGESLQEFEADLRRLVHLAYPEAPEGFREELAAQCFISGLRDNELQRALQISRFSTSSEALVRALEIEAAFSAIPRPKIRSVTVEEQPESTHRSLEEMCRKFDKLCELLINKGVNNNQTENQRRSQDIRCYRCGRNGHIKRDCRVQMRSRSPSRERRHQEN